MTSGWITTKKVAKKCDFCEEFEPSEVLLEPDVMRAVRAMNDAMGNTEWLGYLRGDKIGTKFIVTGIEVPEQEASGASIDNIATVDETNVIGTVHSHHTMGAFVSKTDEDFLAGNYDLTLITSTKGWEGKVRRELPCGHWSLADVEVAINLPIPKFDIDAFVADAKSKVKVKTYPVATTTKNGVMASGLCGKCKTYYTTKSLTWSASAKDMLCPKCLQDVEENVIAHARKKPSKETTKMSTRQCGMCQVYFPWKDLTWLRGERDFFCTECYQLIVTGVYSYLE